MFGTKTISNVTSHKEILDHREKYISTYPFKRAKINKFCSISFLPKISYHRGSPSLSLACTRATKKPASSLSVTSTLWLFVLNTGGFSDSFGASTTWTETRVWWLRWGSPWSAARICRIYSAWKLPFKSSLHCRNIGIWICYIIKSKSKIQCCDTMQIYISISSYSSLLLCANCYAI